MNDDTNVRIERAAPHDRPAIVALLTASGLPLDGLDAHLDTALVARRRDAVVGCAAVEPYRDGALLRSVAVGSGARGVGVGEAVTRAALDLAQALGAPAVYLLTTTADRYFPRFGFEVVSRADVPSSVQESIEFRSACCASAIVMRKWLVPGA